MVRSVMDNLRQAERYLPDNVYTAMDDFNNAEWTTKLLGADATAVTVSEPKTVALAALARRGGYDPVMDYDACTKAAAERILSGVRELAKRQGQNCS